MGKIRVHEFVTLDGSYENPAFTVPYGFTPEMIERTAAWTGNSSALLLGRATWQMFWPAWSTRSDADDPGAAFFNQSPKYVVTSTLSSVEEWHNSHLLGGYDVAAVRELREREDLYVSGSGTLVRALLAEGLVDELHLLVYPVVLGSGAHLFPDGTGELPLALLHSESFTNGVVHLSYGPAAAV